MDEEPSYEELKQTLKVLEAAEAEARAANRKLRESEKRNLAYLENSPVCTKIIDLDFNLQYMSCAGIKALRIDDVTRYYGKPYPFDFFPESFRNRMVDMLQEAVETHEVVTQEAPVVDLEGAVVWFQSTVVPVEDSEGRVEYLTVVSVDTTARKQAEMELEKQNEHLEELVEQRTAELYHSQKMEGLGTLAGGIAHDFNNILGAILSNTELCMSKLSADSEANKYLERIIKSGNRAADLVRQISAFSRTDNTGFKPLDLSLVIQDALKMARATIPANIVFRQSFPKEPLAVYADETQIHQVVINLCSNASDAIGEKGGILEITLEKSVCPDSMGVGHGDCLKLTVEDTGQGITPEVQKRIFDPFFTTKEVGKGTGLGLSVVYGIMGLHEGQITVESQDGQGSVFTLFFPAIEPENQEAHTRESETAKQESGKKEGSILVVDDEPDIVNAYQEFLEDQGYEVTVCEDGYEALVTFKENPNRFDLVLTDHVMPYMTGEQLVPILRGVRPDVPIIMSSGYSDLISEEDADSMGVCRLLMKPLELSLLKDAIGECLGP